MKQDTAVRKRKVEQEEEKPSVYARAFKGESEWEDKDEFLDVIYWLKQILGLLLGCVWGILPLKGFVGLLLFFAINSLIVYVYFNSFQKVDEEEYGGLGEILKEGLMTSFATFLVTWIIFYSAIHTD
ncbi:unnamed protein product [Owenia fusiformis]|uniref:Uncharacterized protein n=1 Tax=Owenia fusiformis TaxID=6347 RepID=A0A8J1TSV9_OWEFU|nr:unnamed protein product [Owenia fusiformis]